MAILVAILSGALARRRTDGDCPGQPPPERLIDYVQATDAELRVVDPSDGIYVQEAEAISCVYMTKYILGCGGPGNTILQGKTWAVTLRFGFAGYASDRTVEVDSHTGSVCGLGGPRYRDFQSFHYGVLVAIARDGH
jgi:hypothetical protein